MEGKQMRDNTYAVETRTDTYFVSAKNKAEAREVMGWTFDHDGITDRKILSITLASRRP